MARDWNLFLSSVFFVLGFSTVFALLGVLLQTILESVGYTVQEWLGRVGGVIIIFFGLYLVGLVKPRFLEREHTFKVKRQFRSMHLTSFVFGAAFAVGWTPCVTAALGAILGLAATQPSGAFILLLSYTLGLGLPFLLVGLFSTQATSLISKAGPYLKYAGIVFGVILILIGILVFTGDLNRFANLQLVSELVGVDSVRLGEGIEGLGPVELAVAFIAGLISFLSPCVLPLVPAFLSYLASIGTKSQNL